MLENVNKWLKECIDTLDKSSAVVDTIWLEGVTVGNITVSEQLEAVIEEIGKSEQLLKSKDEEIERLNGIITVNCTTIDCQRNENSALKEQLKRVASIADDLLNPNVGWCGEDIVAFGSMLRKIAKGDDDASTSA